ncbi:head maturation protease, ClpP-related [Microbulbifer sp. 2205BS26-8]|uniref:head maturation protease, ClpP-related n=1 Tax=Microbulbifer sp. 2205BS26-8 TaxID=3064386 RepID=UPI00273DB1D2|nr:head maturation protease, ClpP-related [Microbulbifer sp. 2205BS26-8]MDP5211063.1 Clp protease ClpP [Microbulbifer sp. 2205BS26-8]
MPKWFEIKAQTETAPAEVYIYDYIGYYGVEAKAFIDALNALDADEIHLRLNTPGGSVFDGNAIYNALKRHKATITTYIDGLAASMGSIIALAGERVIMADNAMYMIHNPWTSAYGDARELRKTADTLDRLRSSMLSIYQKKTEIDEESLAAMLDNETWLSATECVEHGFADETAEGLQAAAYFTLDKFQGYRNIPARWVASAPPANPEKKPAEDVQSYNHRTPLYARLTEIAARA